MITNETTQVWVRVDLKSKRVIAVSDEPLTQMAEKPVFTVAANFSRLDYYAVVDNAAATYGITVRAKTAEERAAADAAVSANTATTIARSKKAKAGQIREFFCSMFMRRFIDRGFMCGEEVVRAAAYTGTDTHMVNDIKPLAVKILNAANEWRFNICQPVIDAMYSDSGMGVDLSDDTYRKTTEDSLDSFLTDNDFDITVYHR